jgi:hypothetical protein
MNNDIRIEKIALTLTHTKYLYIRISIMNKNWAFIQKKNDLNRLKSDVMYSVINPYFRYYVS